eukprot:TRINITY_DN22252_c0_g1_i2.p1 TRINITY_DN22252_c0_g1~~TRINITY_DN22252_c0_g1_i2.p1  ORF type:complete len:512 (-),score=72.32 TRINITY_DN22252_c0_g1_i2:588-1904(-)
MQFVAFPDNWSGPEEAREWFGRLTESDESQMAKLARAFERIFLPLYKLQHDALESYLTTHPFPDVIVSHSVTTAPIDLAHHYGLPLVLVLPQQAAFQHMPLMAYDCGGERTSSWLSGFTTTLACTADLFWHLGPQTRKRDALRHSYGHTAPVDMLAAQHRLILSSVPGLSQPVPLPPLVHFVGPLVTPEAAMTVPGVTPTDELTQWLAEGPAALLAFGSTGVPRLEFFTAVISGVLRATGPNFRVLVACFHCDKPEFSSWASKAGNRVRLELWVPQRIVVSHKNLRLVGTHCGFGSLSEALFSGKPVLAYPFHWDQLSNAARAVAIGAAIRINPHTTSDAGLIEEAALQLLKNASFSDRAQAIARVMRAAGGVARAVEIIEEECAFGSRHLVADSLGLSDFVQLGFWWGMALASAFWLLCAAARCGAFCWRGRKCKQA